MRLPFEITWARVKQVPGWLAGPSDAWLFLSGFAAAILLGFYLAHVIVPEAGFQDRIRYAGWFLDVFGLTAIFLGISGKLRRFKDTNLFAVAFDRLKAWLRAFPLLKRPPVELKAEGVMISGPSIMDADMRVAPGPDWSLEQKVEWLIGQHDTTLDALRDLRRTVNAKTGSLDSKVVELERNLASKIEGLSREAEDVHIGDLGTELVGLSWVFFGITFATVPELLELLVK